MDNNKKVDASPAPSRDARVAALAHSFYQEEGCPEGCYDEHWYRACAIIDAQDAGKLEELPPWLNKAEELPAPQSKVTELRQPHRHKSAA